MALHATLLLCMGREKLLLNCYLGMLNKLQKRVCSTVGPALAASFKSLVYRRNVAGQSLFSKHQIDRCSSELPELIALLYSG